MNHHCEWADTLHRVALGAAAGMAGTMLLQAVVTARTKALPSSVPPLRGDPGQFFLNQIKACLPRAMADQVPPGVEKAASKGLGMGYGVAFGALYGAMRPRQPACAGHLLGEGVLLGLATWASGYLGWLPATGLMPPIWRHAPSQVIAPVVEHAAYGATVAAVYGVLRKYV